MSSDNPSDPAQQPEFLSQGSPATAPKKGKKLVALAGVGVVAAGAIGAGAWGVAQLTGGGPGAATVLPDTTLAYASIDLDPSAGQKIEALKTLKKFPALADRLNLGAKDDIRRFVVDKLKGGGECKGLDYDADLKPWLGEKAAVAAVPNADHVADPVFALQVKDENKAKAGIAKIFETCDSSAHYGVAFLEGYAIVAESDKVASGAVADAKKGTLADDPAYQSAMDSVGDLGVVSLYVSKDGPKALSDASVGAFGGALCAQPDLGRDSAASSLNGMTDICNDLTGQPAAQDQLAKVYKDFKGAAGTVRFQDGGIELALSGKGLPGLAGKGKAEATSIGNLPDTTVAALALSLPDGWVSDLETQLKDVFGEGLYDQMLSEAKTQTGLDLPGDLETLFGKGAVLALDGRTDFGALNSSGDPSGLQAGLRLGADEADVRRIVDGLVRAAGGSGSDTVKVKGANGQVAVGFSEGYLDDLLTGGNLGDNATFRKAVAEADKANAALYVDFDAADHWLDKLAKDLSSDDQKVIDNVKPLGALGASSWLDGDTSHVVVRLSTN
jgi:hypothetical protein